MPSSFFVISIYFLTGLFTEILVVVDDITGSCVRFVVTRISDVSVVLRETDVKGFLWKEQARIQLRYGVERLFCDSTDGVSAVLPTSPYAFQKP